MSQQDSKAQPPANAAVDLTAVRRVIDTDIRPYIQADGGDIEILSLEGNTVRVRLSGACVSCPSSLQTLRMGVQSRLREKFSPDLVVEGV